MSDQPPVPPVPPEPPAPEAEPFAPPAPPVPPAPPMPPMPPMPPAAVVEPGPPVPPPPVPPAPPMQPPAPGAPMPPQMMQPPAPGAPGAPTQKKSRVWIWLVVAGVLLLCCVGVAVALLFGAFVNSGGGGDAKIMGDADVQYKLAATTLTKLQSDAAAVSSDDPASVKTFLASTTEAIKQSRSQLASARSKVSAMSASSEARAAYEQGLDETGKALDSLQTLVDELGGKSDFAAMITDGSSQYLQGARLMNSAVGLMNKNLYSRAGVEAGRAKALFNLANAKFDQAGGADPTADVAKITAYVDLQLDKVDFIIQMANYGVKGNVSAYNKTVPKFNAINKKIAALPEPSELTNPSSTTERITELTTQMTDSLTKAETLFAKAHSLVSGGK